MRFAETAPAFRAVPIGAPGRPPPNPENVMIALAQTSVQESELSLHAKAYKSFV